MPRGGIELAPFSKNDLRRLLGDGYSVEYLHGYLEELRASVMVFESKYIDRHYLDEFAHYYSRSFDAPSASCARLHVFAELDIDAINKILDEAYRDVDGREKAEAELQRCYLGFVVRRPLSGATVGRTVLKTYPAEARRHYEVVRPYKVNLAGLRLEVLGLAYQQQDRGAAVCASTALWSALQRVAYVAGNRTPTPMAITLAAQSPFPASKGLNMPQMATALSSLGYIADHFAPLENRALFKAKIVACLRSQLPVVLLVTRKMMTKLGVVRDGHAVTITGFSEPKSIVNVQGVATSEKTVRMRDASVDVIYVHDDNLGSHAHYELIDSNETDDDGHAVLTLLRGRADDPAPKHSWWVADKWTVAGALVPKPAKQRLGIESLFSAMFWLNPLFAQEIFPGIELDYVLQISSGVEYKRELFKYDVHRENLRDFQAQAHLPRHIGIIRVNGPDNHLCDVLIDVTEVQRSHMFPSVLGIVAPGVAWLAIAHSTLAGFCNKLGAALLTGPERTGSELPQLT